MSLAGYRRLIAVMFTTIIALLALSAYLLVKHSEDIIRTAFAEEQFRIIQDCRDRALRATNHEAAGLLEYASYYYPSGTKQVSGSRLDRMVESQRQRAVADIIEYLRQKTGEDLGPDPQPWIRKYAQRATPATTGPVSRLTEPRCPECGERT
jgi:hypothetical protein